jgi:lipid-binding SYLF domain-containing protein
MTSTGASIAASTVEIDANADSALKMFYEKVGPAKELSAKSKGILAFPDVIKAGFRKGGEYGEGALRINGNTVEY